MKNLLLDHLCDGPRIISDMKDYGGVEFSCRFQQYKDEYELAHMRIEAILRIANFLAENGLEETHKNWKSEAFTEYSGRETHFRAWAIEGDPSDWYKGFHARFVKTDTGYIHKDQI